MKVAGLLQIMDYFLMETKDGHDLDKREIFVFDDSDIRGYGYLQVTGARISDDGNLILSVKDED